MSKVQVDTIDTRSGTSTMQIGSTNTSTINIGVSGDTVNIPSGVTIANAGTATGFGSNKPILSVGLSSPQSMSDNTWTTIVFQTEILDADGIYNNSTGVATPTAGTYLMMFAANVGGGGGSTLKNAGVKFLVGGSVTTAEQTMNEADNFAAYGNLVTTYIQAFDGSTTVACQAYNDVSSGTPSVYGASSPRFGATFQMVKLMS